MVKYNDTRLDAVFRALGDPTRRRMLAHLALGERTVGELAEPFDMSLAAASKHIRALEDAELIDREVLGRRHVCRLNAKPLAAATDWLRHYERFWSDRLDRLEQLLRQADDKPPPTPDPKSKSSTPPHPPAGKAGPKVRPRARRNPKGES